LSLQRGFTPSAVKSALQAGGRNPDIAFEILINDICNTSEKPYKALNPLSLPRFELSVDVPEELMVLQAIFNDDVHVFPDSRGWSVEFEVLHIPGKCKLTIVIPPHTDYPSQTPHVYIANEEFSKHNIPFLTAIMVLEAAKYRGSCVTYALWEWLGSDQMLFEILLAMKDMSVAPKGGFGAQKSIKKSHGSSSKGNKGAHHQSNAPHVTPATVTEMLARVGFGEASTTAASALTPTLPSSLTQKIPQPTESAPSSDMAALTISSSTVSKPNNNNIPPAFVRSSAASTSPPPGFFAAASVAETNKTPVVVKVANSSNSLPSTSSSTLITLKENSSSITPSSTQFTSPAPPKPSQDRSTKRLSTSPSTPTPPKESAVVDVQAALQSADAALEYAKQLLNNRAGGASSSSGATVPSSIIAEEMAVASTNGSDAGKQAASKQLAQEQRAREKSKKFMDMFATRKKLPAYQKHQEILQLLQKHQVLVISGETGCGKTTQIPQFILDDMVSNNRGAECSIICTQPRRISAIGVAERVAQERCEQLGETVGYQIRLEKCADPKKTRLLFCTTGILLRLMQGDAQLGGVSHILVDEIHERDLNSDFLLIILKQLLPTRPDLRIVLMSATLNAEMFSKYFYNCPVVHIPGRTFPVREVFLEHVIDLTGYMLKQTSEFAIKGSLPRPQQQHRASDSPPPASLDSECPVKDLKIRYPRCKLNSLQTLQMYDEEQINYELVEIVVQYIDSSAPNDDDDAFGKGAVLIFLPGLAEITEMYNRLKRNATVGNSNKFLLIPLHSSLSSDEQKIVFARPPKGVRKVVMSTNIAETSITIDDVCFVIDTGKLKENKYDPVSKIPSLELAWVSKANARQRKGRAGRVREGQCFNLYSSFRHSILAEYQLPEMSRVPLSELCLQIRVLNLGKCKDFLLRAMEAPPEAVIDDSLSTLRILDAMDMHENLTALGYHLAQLPVDVRIGKLILFGAMLGCLDPILTIAASMSSKSPFVAPFDKREEADRCKRIIAKKCQSDHIALVYAYNNWRKCASRSEAFEYCRENFLSANSLKLVSEMKRQLCLLLYDIGFARSHRRHRFDSQFEFGDEKANSNSENEAMIRAVLVAGCYPNICRAEKVTTAKGKNSIRIRNRDDKTIDVHPSSVLYGEESGLSDKWLVYHTAVRTSKFFIRDSTVIPPYAILMFGGDLSMRHTSDTRCVVSMDNWVRFECPRVVGVVIRSVRQKLDLMLLHKIENPREDLSDLGQAVIGEFFQLLQSCAASSVCFVLFCFV
jgi:HrpA-like RNA helicase